MSILCIGQLVTEILVRPVEIVDYQTDTVRVEDISMKNGGDAMNVAIGLAKLGNSVKFIGIVGNDSFGVFLKEVLLENSIDISGLKVSEKAPTSSVIALINKNGDRTFLYYGGTNDLISANDVDEAAIKSSDIVHIGGTYMLSMLDGAGSAELFKIAHNHGKITTMDVTYDSKGVWLDTIKPCLKHLDYFMQSINEAKHIAQKENPEDIAQFLLDESVGTVVIKLGQNGCYVKNDSVSFYHPAFFVPVLDTTGAGDAFVSGFITGLHRGLSLEKCAQIASAAGAFAVQSLGATTGIPSLHELEQFIVRHNLNLH